MKKSVWHKFGTKNPEVGQKIWVRDDLSKGKPDRHNYPSPVIIKNQTQLNTVISAWDEWRPYTEQEK